MHRGGALLRRCAGTGQPGEAFEQALGGVHTFGRLAASFHELAVYCSSLRREKQKPDVLTGGLGTNLAWRWDFSPLRLKMRL